MTRALVIAAFLLARPLLAFTPVLTLVEPRGGQRGTEVEVHFHGERLEEIEEALFFQPGLELRNLNHVDAKHATATLAITADAALGEHSLRLRTARGITELRSFWVGQFPGVNEGEPNNSSGQAQRVGPGVTIHGVAGNEDEDHYVVAMKKGERLSAEAEAMRLGRTMFDVHLALLDPRGFELASCDDTPLLRTDAFVSIIAPEDGDYRIVVREAAYEGNDSCQYRLHVGSFPRPSAVFPPGGKPGETLEFTFIGDPAGPIKRTITLPADASGMFPLFCEDTGFSAPSPNWIHISPLDHTSATDESTAREKATPMPAIPSAAHGILSAGRAGEWFRFSAKKGENLVLRMFARGVRSPLDPVLSLHDSGGRQLADNDDQGGPDSLINWACPEDGEYLAHIRDQLRRSGPDFTYRLEIVRREPSIQASLPVVERVNSQKWKTFPVSRGNRYAAVINLTRENTGCDVAFSADALPPGVTLHAPPVPRSISSFPVIFEAAADAPIGGGLYAFGIRSTGDPPELTGRLTDTIHHVDINNQGAYHSVTIDRIATAVTREVPVSIELEQPRTPIVRNGTLPLKVRVHRRDGHAEKITVRFLWNPPGVSGPVTIEIPGDQSEATYELNANGDAAIATWPVCVLAETTTPGGPVLVSSGFANLEVAEPFVSTAIDLAATEQGRPVSLVVKIETLREFSGPAKLEIAGLPHGVSAPTLEITSGKEEVIVPLEVAPDAAVGKHTSLFCRILVPGAGGEILHLTGHGGTLRIDKPAPVAARENAPPPEKKPEDKPAEKPLSRLEQLRQQNAR